MILDRVTSGEDIPHNANVIVEIPAHSVEMFKNAPEKPNF